MIIFPAIDLKNGQCVRLFKGDMNQATVFNDSPKNQAREFENAGFKYLHVVDLDGAIEGHAANKQAVVEILQTIKIPMQLGGGIRSLQAVEDWLKLGVERVKEAAKNFPEKIVVGIDAKNCFVATEGWVETSEIKVLELAKKFEDCGVAAIIYTDISRDGTLSGLDFEGTKALAQNLKIPVIASGGVSSIADIEQIATIKNIGGAIVGRALYDKKVIARDLLKL
jgi:phosphoribosylformimino-5-aminoimidazole carboxamide ribotide isomerase